ncbi:NADH dehydrogenase 1 alpha subcomplex assembly factor 3 [Crepidotus variabilis]|uniref:NADH dehydrogenase [ubiquinone] 1 alpha subcomplex assembly factor 3 n=1 Tax=Crepidotus variabilis TaxID=179855 RepID=A0A9P6EED8_9AGAR|nr:NADH dehydrogenase 1 alpha subcomplex assembly factor 3 [Crepidotus variabilis]
MSVRLFLSLSRSSLPLRRLARSTGPLNATAAQLIQPAQSQSIQFLRALHATAATRDRSFTNLLADDTPPAVQVSSISEQGIHLIDGLMIPGPCMFLEGKVFLWDVPSLDMSSRVSDERWLGWSDEKFELLDAVTPRPEMLILGTGKTLVQPPGFIRETLTMLGIQLEVMDTRNACSTYNLLSEEGRRVAAALLPLAPHLWKKNVMTGNHP